MKKFFMIVGGLLALFVVDSAQGSGLGVDVGTGLTVSSGGGKGSESDCMGNPSFDYDVRALVAVEGDHPEDFPNSGTFGSAWDLTQAVEVKRFEYHDAENCGSGDRKSPCLESDDATDWLTMAATQSETWDVSIICSMTYSPSASSSSHYGWEGTLGQSSNRVFNSTTGPRIALGGTSSGAGATLPDWVSLCFDFTDMTSVDIAVNGAATYTGLDLSGANGEDPDHVTLNAFAPDGGGAQVGSVFGRLVGYSVDPGKTLTELSECLESQWAPTYDVGEPYVDFDSRYLAGADSSAVSAWRNDGTGSATYALAQATGVDQPLLRTANNCSGGANRPCVHLVDASDHMNGGAGGGSWTVNIQCLTAYFPPGSGSLTAYTARTGSAQSATYDTGIFKYRNSGVYGEDVAVEGWHTVCSDISVSDGPIYVDGVEVVAVDSTGAPQDPTSFSLGTYDAIGSSSGLDLEIGRLWSYNEDPGISLAALSLRGQAAWGFPLPEPPESFVCRLEPLALDAAYAEGDPISLWAADADSAKTTECNVTQGTGTAQPTFRESCAEFGAASCVEFDGGDWLNSLAFASPETWPSTTCAVAVQSVAATAIVFGDNLATYGHFSFSATGSRAYHPTQYDYFTVPNVLGTGNSICLSYDSDGRPTLHMNGTTQVNPSGNVHVGSVKAILLGKTYNAAQHLEGRIGEIVIYDHALTTTEVSEWYSYTCTRYGLGC